MDEKQQQGFDQHAIVELMGHQRIAGRVREETVFGAAMVRVDVPPVDGRAGFTKYFGPSAVYAMTPVEEVVAKAAAAAIRQVPVEPYTLTPAARDAMMLALDGPAEAKTDEVQETQHSSVCDLCDDDCGECPKF